MDRLAAMLKAAEIVAEMGDKPDLNSRGYKIDGWKAPTVQERTDAILAISNFLAEDIQVEVLDGWIEATSLEDQAKDRRVFLRGSARPVLNANTPPV